MWWSIKKDIGKYLNIKNTDDSLKFELISNLWVLTVLDYSLNGVSARLVKNNEF